MLKKTIGKKWYLLSVLFFVVSPFYAKGLLIKIPVRFDPRSEFPLLEVKIDEKKYVLGLDWGIYLAWVLEQDALEEINDKIPEGTCSYRDMKGNLYSAPTFRLPLIEIGNLHLHQALGAKENEEFKTVGSIVWPSLKKESAKLSERIHGTIGREAFRDWNILFDFPHLSLYLSQKEISDFRKENWLILHQVIEIPFEENKNGTIVSLETDLGSTRFMLDTGSTHSCLRSSRVKRENAKEVRPEKWVFTSQKFGFGDIDFGKKEFFLFEFTSILNDVDGILGVDFFKHHIIYLDYKNKKVLICKPRRFSLSRWKLGFLQRAF